MQKKGSISASLCDPAGIRTQDHYIKSVMLYQLSYGIVIVTPLLKRKKGSISASLCDPAGTRTQDPNIKSVMLYRLSYGIITFTFVRNV